MKTAFPQTQNPVSIRLYANIPFDNTYEHHSLISDKFKYSGTNLYTGGSSLGSPCERFINRRRQTTGYPYYYPRWDMTGEYNFDFKNGLMGSVTLELTPEQTNANYMRVTCGSDVYYYFITGISQDNFETYTLSLELDVIMTYQDEFLDGIENRPLFTERKHCHRYTNNGLFPHCADFKSGDSAFAGVKPSVVKQVEDLHFYGDMEFIEEVKWLYVCVDPDYINETNKDKMLYAFKGIKHPLAMICLPINATIRFDLTNEDIGTPYQPVFDENDLKAVIEDLVGNGKVHSCKLSSYPPFIASSIGKNTDNDYTISGTYSVEDGMIFFDNSKTKLYLDNLGDQDPQDPKATRFFVVLDEFEGDYDFEPCNLETLFKNSVKPTPYLSRYNDPKLLFNPFRKYLLTSVYSSGNEFFPELQFADGVWSDGLFIFSSVFTSYIADFNIFTYQRQRVDDKYMPFYIDYKMNNIGLSANVNYTIPCGINALDSFNQSQAQSFYQSKTASGITAGLSILGGVASIGAGIFSENPMLLVAGGTAISGGIAGVTNTIKSTTAKIEDLKNTPDAINVQGGSFVSDYARFNDLPFVTIYDVAEVIKTNANDYFYNYGYEVSRDCNFTKDIAFDNDVSGGVDNNLIGRSVFNYIKLKEDITCKINANIPLLVKQKISQVFNKGITLWSFFGLAQLWGTTDTPNPDYNIDNWFLQHELDNTEYSLIAE